MRIEFIEDDPDAIDYAIGDIHGCVDHLRAALDWCAEDARANGMRARIHLLGDYEDRGPDAKAVLDTLIDGPSETDIEWLPLRGNHDHVFASVIKDPNSEFARDWWAHGGQQTLMSYGWNPLEDGMPNLISEWVPESHLAFLDALPLARKVGQKKLFVHAGIRPGRSLEEQTDRDLMWIRGEFHKSKEDFGFMVIHGHEPDAKHPRQFENRLALDAGCFYTNNLAVAAFDPFSMLPRIKVVSREDIARPAKPTTGARSPSIASNKAKKC